MKKLTLVPIALALATPAFAAENINAKVDQLSDRLTELEVAQQLQKVKFSGMMLNYFEAFKSDTDRLTPFGMYVGLNADFEVSKRLKFYSTLGMSKFFNDEGRSEALNSQSDSGNAPYVATEMGAWAYGGAGVKFDRAFLSYEVESLPLTLAIGRMPTNGGPPLNQMDGLPRQGTYPRFTFNSIFDGMAAVYNFGGLLPKDHSFKVRAFYQPFVLTNPSERTQQLVVDGIRYKSLSNQYAVLAEYSVKNLGFLGQFDLMYMHAAWSNFFDGSFFDEDLGVDTGTDEYGSDHGLFVNLEDIGDFGLNLSWSGLLYTSTTRDDPDHHRRAWGHLVNVNQRLPFLWNSIIGLELIHTDSGFYLDDWTRMYLIPFYGLQNSNGQHLFYSVPVSSRVSARVGYYNIRAGIGDDFQPDPLNAYSYYGMLRVDF
jgi:hypothetical protein